MKKPKIIDFKRKINRFGLDYENIILNIDNTKISKECIIHKMLYNNSSDSDSDIIKYINDYNVNKVYSLLAQKDNNSMTPFLIAIWKNRFYLLTYLINNYNKSSFCEWLDYITFALSCGQRYCDSNENIIKFLINICFNYDSKKSYNNLIMTILRSVSLYNDLDFMKLLLQNFKSLDINKHPLSFAFLNKHYDMCNLLLSSSIPNSDYEGTMMLENETIIFKVIKAIYRNSDPDVVFNNINYPSNE